MEYFVRHTVSRSEAPANLDLDTIGPNRPGESI